MSRTVAKISRREKWKRYIEKNRKGNWYFFEERCKRNCVSDNKIFHAVWNVFFDFAADFKQDFGQFYGRKRFV